MCFGKTNLKQDFIKFEKPRIRASFKPRFDNSRITKERSLLSQLQKEALGILESLKSVLVQKQETKREAANSVLQTALLAILESFGFYKVGLVSGFLCFDDLVRIFEVLILYNHICVGEGRFLVKGGGKYGFNIPTYKASASFGRASKSFS
ncbi:hypothetical protein BBW65_05925 [Helicobacter enhydrae]|uniref:Uncharacterized protein n=1 Tax=Helicobacter enhydrae TaxID=222136 RepID=A0A1B1U6E6_9HELI|nr:hypothetical protein [Helicobacter enhydrae]ANV98363.1 hypothetical protein BBW65_05925 [Helicobacter enhydrae]